MMHGEYQPRYVAYAQAHGRTPDAQIAADKECYPGGCMAGFIVWIGEQLREWKRETNWRGIGLSNAEHEAFNQWLLQRTAQPQAA